MGKNSTLDLDSYNLNKTYPKVVVSKSISKYCYLSRKR